MFDKVLIAAGALAGALAIRLLGGSCKVTVRGAENDPLSAAAAPNPEAVPIYVAWHQRMFGFFLPLGRRHTAVMISRSRDGEMVSRAAEHLGFRSIRGSSTRGAVGALRELRTVLARRRPVGFLADGPKGPPRRSKLGPVAASSLRGDPIVPLAWNADRKWILESWDRYYLPKPFARMVLYIGKPIRVRPNASREELEAARLALEKALDDLCERADGHFQTAGK